MAVIATALGMFYLLAAALVLRRVRMEWFLDRAIETISGKPEPDRYRVVVMAASALLYGAAGLALVLRSGWAVWLLGAGLMAQALYYGVLWLWLRLGSGADGADMPDRWQGPERGDHLHRRLCVRGLRGAHRRSGLKALARDLRHG